MVPFCTPMLVPFYLPIDKYALIPIRGDQFPEIGWGRILPYVNDVPKQLFRIRAIPSLRSDRGIGAASWPIPNIES